MALTVALTETFSATKVILTDVTEYNAPPEAFANYGHYAIIRKKNVNDVEDEVLTLDAYNPVTATEFTADRDEDGWYESNHLLLSIWVDGTAYTAGTLATGSVVDRNGVPYYCIQSHTSPGKDPATESAYWTEVTDLTEIEDNPSIISTFKNRTTAYNANVYWSQQIANASQRGIIGIAPDDRQKLRLDNIYFHLQCVLVGDQLGSNTQAQWNVLALQQLGAR